MFVILLNACFAILHFKMGRVVSFCKVRTIELLETVRSDNGDVPENVAEKDITSFETILQLSQVTLLLKRREFRVGSKDLCPCPSSDRDGRIYRLATLK